MQEKRANYRILYITKRISYQDIPKAYRTFKPIFKADIYIDWAEKLVKGEVKYHEIPEEFRRNKIVKHVKELTLEPRKILPTPGRGKSRSPTIMRKGSCHCCGILLSSRATTPGTDSFCGDCLKIISVGLAKGQKLAKICHWDEQHRVKRFRSDYGHLV